MGVGTLLLLTTGLVLLIVAFRRRVGEYAGSRPLAQRGARAAARCARAGHTGSPPSPGRPRQDLNAAVRRAVALMEGAASEGQMDVAVGELRAAARAAGKEARGARGADVRRAAPRAARSQRRMRQGACNWTHAPGRMHQGACACTRALADKPLLSARQAALSRETWLTLAPLLAYGWAPSSPPGLLAAESSGTRAWRQRLSLCEALLVHSPASGRHARQVRTGHRCAV